MKSYRTIKVYAISYRMLKLIAARTGETLVDLVDRLSKEENNRRAELAIDSHNDSHAAQKVDRGSGISD